MHPVASDKWVNFLLVIELCYNHSTQQDCSHSPIQMTGLPVWQGSLIWKRDSGVLVLLSWALENICEQKLGEGFVNLEQSVDNQ